MDTRRLYVFRKLFLKRLLLLRLLLKPKLPELVSVLIYSYMHSKIRWFVFAKFVPCPDYFPLLSNDNFFGVLKC